jgi:hypothetical protein
MKGPLVYIILLLSFGAMLFVYRLKDKNERDQVDHVEQSLSDLKRTLDPGARLQFTGMQTDPVNGWEMQLLVRYALIPVIMAPDIPSDTAVHIMRRDDTATQVPAGEVIWQKEDSLYLYRLIKKVSNE